MTNLSKAQGGAHMRKSLICETRLALQIDPGGFFSPFVFVLEHFFSLRERWQRLYTPACVSSIVSVKKRSILTRQEDEKGGKLGIDVMSVLSRNNPTTL